MAIVARLEELLDKNGIKYTVIAHSNAYSAQEIAALIHVPGKDLAKSVIVRTGDGKYAMIVLPAHHHVMLDALEPHLGKDVRLASEDELRALFPDTELGAMPPFGNLYDLPVWVTEPITRDSEIVFNAGTHTEVIRMRYDDFDRLVKPRVAAWSRVMTGPPRFEPYA